MKIEEFGPQHIEAVEKLSDEVIGPGYYFRENLLESLEKSKKGENTASLVLVGDHGEVLGFRLTYPPSDWLKEKREDQVRPDLWKVNPDSVAYFKTIFISPKLKGQGWGSKLSMASIEKLRHMGAKAVLCHSWKESPNNSSMRYLEKIGFQSLVEYPEYWKEVDYHCVRCGKPCLCTATELVFYL